MGKVKKSIKNIFPFFYLNDWFGWKTFTEFVPNKEVSNEQFFALDRAGDNIIIDATNNT